MFQYTIRASGDFNKVNNGRFYIHSDHLGSTSTLSDQNGAQVGPTTRYTPFGDYRTGSQSDITDRGFTGHRENRGIGLTYMNARYYLPGNGRFLSADIIVPNPADPQSFNRYSYVKNNPLNRVDPTGHFDLPDDDDLPVTTPDGCDPTKATCVWSATFMNSSIMNEACEQGNCQDGQKALYFGIPFTEEGKLAMIQKEARSLCFEFGSCAQREVGIYMNILTAGMGQALMGLFTTGFNIAVDIGDKSPGGAGASALTETAGQVVSESKIGGRLIGGISTYMGIQGYYSVQEAFVREAITNVDARINAANDQYNQQAYSGYFTTTGSNGLMSRVPSNQWLVSRIPALWVSSPDT